MPDVALVAAWVTLVYCLFLFQGYQKLFRDSDAGWHIRTGEAIVATGALPRTDPYSFTMQGKPWLAWEWGADVLMGSVHRVSGLSGVAMLYGLAIASGVWLWFRLHRQAGGTFLLACAMAPLLLSTCNIHWLARPHVLGWIFLLATIAVVRSAPDRFRARHAWGLALGSALWANLHASFLFAPLAALLYAAGHAVRPFLWQMDRAAEWRRARWLLAAATTAVLGSLINPYGWHLHEHILRYLTDTPLLDRIGEFQSFNFHAEGAGQIVATLLLGIVGGVLALGQRRLADGALAFAIAAAAVRSARFLPLVALLLLPLANGTITACLRTASGLRTDLRRGIDAFLAYSDNLGRLDASAGGWAVAWTVPALAWMLLTTPAIAQRTGFPPDQFPVAAYDRVAELPANTRLFAPDKFGGYLIYRSNGIRKVFFDGRSDLYGARFLQDYGRMVQVRPGWRQLWDRFAFTHALMPNDYSLIPALRQNGWSELYRDRTATLLAAPASRPGGQN